MHSPKSSDHSALLLRRPKSEMPDNSSPGQLALKARKEAEAADRAYWKRCKTRLNAALGGDDERRDHAVGNLSSSFASDGALGS